MLYNASLGRNMRHWSKRWWNEEGQGSTEDRGKLSLYGSELK